MSIAEDNVSRYSVHNKEDASDYGSLLFNNVAFWSYGQTLAYSCKVWRSATRKDFIRGDSLGIGIFMYVLQKVKKCAKM